MTAVVAVRDGKELEPSKNELNQNPRFAKNRTEPEPKCPGSFTVLSPNETVDCTFTHFTVNEAFYFT